MVSSAFIHIALGVEWRARRGRSGTWKSVGRLLRESRPSWIWPRAMLIATRRRERSEKCFQTEIVRAWLLVSRWVVVVVVVVVCVCLLRVGSRVLLFCLLSASVLCLSHHCCCVLKLPSLSGRVLMARWPFSLLLNLPLQDTHPNSWSPYQEVVLLQLSYHLVHPSCFNLSLQLLIYNCVCVWIKYLFWQKNLF